MLRWATNASGDDSLAKYVIDDENSLLGAVVDYAEPERVWWNIHIAWINEEETEPAFKKIWAEITYVDFQESNWRLLAGKSARVTYDAKMNNPANFYLFSSHEAPIDNCICILNRDRTRFEILWTCTLDVRPKGEAVEIIEKLFFKGIAVRFADQASINADLARQTVNRLVPVAAVGAASVAWEWVSFPLDPALAD